MLVGYLSLQLVHLLYPQVSYRWSIEQGRVSVPSLLIMGSKLLLENCTITTLGQSANTEETIDLSHQVHLLKRDVDYVDTGNSTSVLWLLDPDVKWSLTPSAGVNDVANEFLQINITVQEGNPALPVDPAFHQSIWSNPPQIYLLDKLKVRSPMNLSMLEPIYGYSEKHQLASSESDESYTVINPIFTATDVPFPRDKKRIELIITPDLPTTNDGKRYLVETYRQYRDYNSADFLESVLLIIAIGIIALLAIFNAQNPKSVFTNASSSSPSSPSPSPPSPPSYNLNQGETRVAYNQTCPSGHRSQLASTKLASHIQESSSRNNYNIPTSPASSSSASSQASSPSHAVGNRSIDSYSTDSNVTSPASGHHQHHQHQHRQYHHNDTNETAASQIFDESSDSTNDLALSEYSEPLAQPRITQGRRYRYTAYSLQQSEDWLVNSQYHEGNQSEISIDISDGDIAIARHAVIRSVVSID
ncbi:hypothetical protein BDF22DRAFT_775182 [Syncephalis plumigaleata]|nr:hypothetical protein BDF22DRAFT_775182 [Syncephalis plumigaleata]